MYQYLDAIRETLNIGEDLDSRNGKVRSLFGVQMRFSLLKGFPIITTKKVNFGLVKAELLWMLSGSRNVKDLNKLGCHIWDANAYDEDWMNSRYCLFPGDVGRGYGVQWRGFNRSVDQIKNLIKGLKEDSHSRRHLVSAWNPSELNQTCLPPCHFSFICSVANDYLTLQVFIRSNDAFLGCPFNISQYALLAHLIANVTGYKPKELIYNAHNFHIYHNHLEAVMEQSQRKPYHPPKIWINPSVNNIDDFTMNDIRLVGYKHHPAIKGEMSV